MKDNNNLLSFNVWSGGDYKQSTDGFISSNCKLTTSNKFSINGENSLKITTQIRDDWPLADTNRIYDKLSGNITAELKIYAPEGDMLIILFAYSPNKDIARIIVPKNDNIQSIKLTGDIPIDYNYLTIRLFPRTSDVPFYIDDLSLTID